MVEAADAHSNTPILRDTSEVLRVKIVDRAELELGAFVSAPEAAIDRVVSAGQPFRVTALIENPPGRALVYDSAKVRLNLPGNFSSTEPLLKKVAAGDSLHWWVSAP